MKYWRMYIFILTFKYDIAYRLYTVTYVKRMNPEPDKIIAWSYPSHIV